MTGDALGRIGRASRDAPRTPRSVPTTSTFVVAFASRRTRGHRTRRSRLGLGLRGHVAVAGCARRGVVSTGSTTRAGGSTTRAGLDRLDHPCRRLDQPWGLDRLDQPSCCGGGTRPGRRRTRRARWPRCASSTPAAPGRPTYGCSAPTCGAATGSRGCACSCSRCGCSRTGRDGGCFGSPTGWPGERRSGTACASPCRGTGPAPAPCDSPAATDGRWRVVAVRG